MARPTRIWFIRHGEVATDHIGTFTGSTDVPLSDVGRHQAQAIAGFLADAYVDAIVSSPLARAQQTAAPLVEQSGQDVRIEPALREMDFGEWEGLRWDQIEDRDPQAAARFAAAEHHKTFPGGEDTQGFMERVMPAFDALVDEYAGKSLVVFAHAGVNRAFLSRITGLPYLDTFVFAQDYGCVNAAAWDATEGHGQLALLNVVPGPPSEDHGDGGRNVASL